MSEIVDFAYKFGAGRFFQGTNVIEKIGYETSLLSDKAYILGSPTALKVAGSRITESLKSACVEYVIREYSGFCCYSAAEKFIKELQENSCSVVIGVGGGRIMDLAKLIADKASIPVVNVPTSTATCAAYTALSVIYDENGKTVCDYYLPREVSAIFAEESILVKQPERLLAAGIMDALAKHIEIKNGHKEVNSDNFYIDLLTASTLATCSYENILRFRHAACEDLLKNNITKDFSSIIFLCLPITGMISGISKGVGQSAIAHALYYQLRKNFTEEALNYLHGEVVAIGLLAQLYYNGTPECIPEFENIMREMGMPTTLNEIGIPGTQENFDLLYSNLSKTPFVGDSDEKRKLFKEALSVIFKI